MTGVYSSGLTYNTARLASGRHLSGARDQIQAGGSPPHSMDVGAALRDAREQRGLSLDQLAQTTKIRVTTLQAIETNRKEKLPEAIFLRGFVRAYAREVGLDPEDTVRQYLGQFEPTIVEIVQPSTNEARSEGGRAVRVEIDHEKARRRATRVQWISLVIVVIGGAAYYTVARWRTPGPPATHSTPVATASEIAGPSSAGSVSPAAVTAGVEAAATGPGGLTAAGATENVLLHLDIRALGPCWLSATVDGTRVVNQLMQPGEHRTIEVHDEAVLRIGDAAAFAFSINGREGRVLGRVGEALTVHITPQNYREFLRRSTSP